MWCSSRRRVITVLICYIYWRSYVQLKQSGHGIYIEQLFVGCVCYADDIALLSASCYGLQKLVDIDIRSSYGISWDIKFNPLKSQLITFGGCNPAQCVITINGNSIPWVPKVKYLGIFSHCYYWLQKHVEISIESLKVSRLFLVNAPMWWLHFIYLKRTAYQLWCMVVKCVINWQQPA